MTISEMLCDELGNVKILRISMQRQTHKEVLEFNSIVNAVAYANKDQNVADVVVEVERIKNDVFALLKCFNNETKERFHKLFAEWLEKNGL